MQTCVGKASRDETSKEFDLDALTKDRPAPTVLVSMHANKVYINISEESSCPHIDEGGVELLENIDWMLL